MDIIYDYVYTCLSIICICINVHMSCMYSCVVHIGISTTKRCEVTQITVGVDGLAVVVALNGAGHNCLTASLGGLTRAQLSLLTKGQT